MQMDDKRENFEIFNNILIKVYLLKIKKQLIGKAMITKYFQIYPSQKGLKNNINNFG
jgi:hypothetical protein